MSDILAVARQQLADAEAQIQALQAKATTLRSFLKTANELEAIAGAEASATGHVVVLGHGTMTAVGAAPSISVTESIRVRAVRAARQLLSYTEPQTARQLLEGMKQMGVEIGGSDPASNLSAILSQHKKDFTNIKGKGYFLADSVELQKTEAADASTSAAPLWTKGLTPR